MKIFIFAATMGKDGLNEKLAETTSNFVKNLGHESNFHFFDEFKAPLYSSELDQPSIDKPEGVLKFSNELQTSDGLIIVSPEYNYSIPGPLKNLIDWVSRIRPMPWDKARILLMAASPSVVGGRLGLAALRIPLEGCGSFVYPKTFSLAQAHQAFDENGNFNDPALTQRLERTIGGFCQFAQALKEQK